MKVAIIDYEAGNLRNVQKAIEKFNINAEIISDGEELVHYDSIVLPGVGSFYHGMNKLIERNFKKLIREEVLVKKKPFLGICLGMQLMGKKGEEGETCEGLNILPFEVKHFGDTKLRIPHIGWNNIKKNPNSKLLYDIPDNSDFYFVHSYHIDKIEKKYVSGICEYGIEFVAAIESENIFGTQFHPEKSQQYGLKIIENFLKISLNQIKLNA